MKTVAPSRSEKVLLAGILNQVADGLLRPLLEVLRHAVVEELLPNDPASSGTSRAAGPVYVSERRTLPFELNYAGYGEIKGWSSQVHLLALCSGDESVDLNGAAVSVPESPVITVGWGSDAAQSGIERRFVEFARGADAGSSPLICRVLPSAEHGDGLLVWLPVVHRRQIIGRLGISLWDQSWWSVPTPIPSTWAQLANHAGLEHATWVLPAQWSHPRYRAHVPSWLVRLAIERGELVALREGFARWNRIRSELEHVLVPTIRIASWKEKAGRIMHELANSIATMDAPLESIAQELSRSLLDLRYQKEDADGAQGPSDSVALAGAIARLQGAAAGFDFLRRNQIAAKNKVLWYFFLMEGKLKTDEEEVSPLQELITETCERLDSAAKVCRFSAPDDPAWATILAMPPQFLGHCAQALLSNAVRHRLSGSHVDFVLRKQDDGSLLLEWQNTTSRMHVERFRRATDRNEPDSFGLAVAHEVSREFLGSELVIEAEGDCVRHTIRLQRCSPRADVFFSLGAWMQSRRVPQVQRATA